MRLPDLVWLRGGTLDIPPTLLPQLEANSGVVRGRESSADGNRHSR